MPSQALSADDIKLTDMLIEWGKDKVKKGEKPTYWAAEKEFKSKKFKSKYKLKFYKSRFHSKLFLGGMKEFLHRVGYRETAQDSKRLFGASTTGEIEPIHVSPKESFEGEVERYKQDLIDLSYQARSDPEKTLEFARIVLSEKYPDLWDRFEFMSNGRLEETFRQAIDLAGGAYIKIVKKAIASGNDFDNSYDSFVTWLKESVEAMQRVLVMEKRGAEIPPGTRDSICWTCNNRRYLTSKNSIRCLTCREPAHWTCIACGQSLVPDNHRQMSCPDCRYRVRLDPPLRKTARRLEHEIIDLRPRPVRTHHISGEIVHNGDLIRFDHYRELS